MEASIVVELDLRQVADFARTHGLGLVALFGSAARNEKTSHDVDLALLPDRENSSVVELARAMTRHFRRADLDLAWLPSAGGLLWREVARDGVVLYEARPGLFRRFQHEALRRGWEAGRWRERNRRFVHRLLEGPLELNRELVFQDLAFLGDYLGRLDEVLSVSCEAFVADFRNYHTAERLLQLMVESAAQINTEVGQAIDRTPATDYYSSFFVLSGAGWITAELARELAELAGLRNVLVHRYEQIGVDQLYATLQASLPHWRAYLEQVADKLG